MMPGFRTALVSGLVILTGLPGATAAPTSRHSQALALVVTVDGSGTAFHTGRGCWITAAHVLDTARAAELVVHTGAVFLALVKARNEAKDAAVLKANADVPFLSVSTRIPRVRERVWAIGFPGESRLYGQVVPLIGRIHPNTGMDGLVWISGVAFHGHSGSPVLDEHGSVVGMLIAVHPSVLDVSIATPGNAIKQLMSNCR